jgi:hypothetical protein
LRTAHDLREAPWRVSSISKTSAGYADKLAAQGLKTTEALLAAGGTAEGRQEFEAATGISAPSILKWMNRADLFRVKGIGTQ